MPAPPAPGLFQHSVRKVRSDLYAVLDALGIATTPHGMSIGRVDYAVDVLAPKFVLDPECFLMHSRATRRDHREFSSQEQHGRSGRYTSVRVGKMPGREVIIYDKRDEVLTKQKAAWWEIWNENRRAVGKSLLVPTDATTSQIWRIELRAGKACLKDPWRIRSWSDLDKRLGDLMADTLDAVRYCAPSSDTNRSRWPDDPLWQLVRREISGDLFKMRSHADPERVKEVYRAEHRRMLLGQLEALTLSLAVLEGQSPKAYPRYVSAVPRELISRAHERSESVERRFEAKKGEYVFL